MNVTMTSIGTAVAITFELTEGIKRVMKPDQLKENIPDLPLLQIYPQSFQGAVAGSQNDRNTFKAGVRTQEQVWFVDVYARQRSYIGEDMQKVVELSDAVIQVLERQNEKPYFGQVGIQGFRWQGERVTFSYGDPEQKYVGVRFTLTFTIF